VGKNTSGLRPPWPAGVSGNPNGRPLYSGVSDAARRFLEQSPSKRHTPKSEAEAQALALLRRARKRDRATEILLDRAEGKVPQAITGADGAPLIPPELVGIVSAVGASSHEQLLEERAKRRK